MGAVNLVIGAVEAGGTKMVCAVGDENGSFTERAVFPTETPEITIPKMLEFFSKFPLDALGIGCFGPLDLNPQSNTYGFITSTPKLAWRNVNILSEFEKGLNIPAALDTDVNGAALGEAVLGAGKGKNTVIYITIGTGVGVGVYLNGMLLHGLIHPEAGHIMLTKREDDPFEGICPYHHHCMEGLASGPSIRARWGKDAKELVDNDAVWELEADYIAQAVSTYILAYSPERIILSGGVMHQKQLFPLIRKKVKEQLNGYLSHPVFDGTLEDYIVWAGLGDDAGIKGALLLGKSAVLKKRA